MFRRFASLLVIAPSLVLNQAASASAEPTAEERLSYLSRPAVVRVVVACIGTYYYDSNKTPDNPNDDWDYPYATGELGTGFFVDPKGYIATNSHLVQPAAGGEAVCKERLFRNLVDDITGENVLERVPAERVKEIEAASRLEGFQYAAHVILPNGDPFSFKVVAEDDTDRTNVAVIKIEVTDAPILKLLESDDAKPVNLQESLLAIGYPTAAESFETIGLLININTQGSNARALSAATITDARVSSANVEVPTSNATGTGGISVLQLSGDNILTDSGSAGSPVLNQNGEVTGMVSDFRKGVGVPLVVPSSTIIDFIQRAGAENQESIAGSDYRDGLERFWRGDYPGAESRFESVKTRFPQHSEINDLIDETTRKLSEQRHETTYLPWLLGLGGVATALLGACAYLFFKNQSSRRQFAPAQVGMIQVDPVPTPLPASMMPRRATSFLPSPVSNTQPYLELRNQRGQVQRFALRGDRHQLGRGREWADISLPDHGWEVLSRKHALLCKEQDDYRIYDGDGTGPSMNGIFLNDVLIDLQEGYLLRDQDQLQIGQDPDSFVTLTYFNPRQRSQ